MLNNHSRKPVPQDRQALKWNVRKNLQGRLFRAFFACLIPALLPWLLQLFPMDVGPKVAILAEPWLLGTPLLVTAISYVTSAFVTDPMKVRLARYFMQLNVKPDQLPSPLWVCDCFGEGYLRNMLAMLARKVLVGIAFLLPLTVGALIPGVAAFETIDGIFTLIPTDWFFVACVPAIILGLWVELTLAMTPYLLAAEPGLSAMDALRESAKLMRGRKLELLVLELSFLGWMLAMTVTFFLAGIFAYPYMEGTIAAYFLAIRPTSSAAGPVEIVETEPAADDDED